MKGKTVSADPERAVAAIFEALKEAGARVLQKRDPAVLPKALKNEAEIAGHRAAQPRAGPALVRLLHWLPVERSAEHTSELQSPIRILHPVSSLQHKPNT